jgi:transcriptional regulator with AAA-type ATPase domain
MGYSISLAISLNKLTKQSIHTVLVKILEATSENFQKVTKAGLICNVVFQLVKIRTTTKKINPIAIKIPSLKNFASLKFLLL